MYFVKSLLGGKTTAIWIKDLIAREVYLHPQLRLLRSFDERQTFWPVALAQTSHSKWQDGLFLFVCVVGHWRWYIGISRRIKNPIPPPQPTQNKTGNVSLIGRVDGF